MDAEVETLAPLVFTVDVRCAPAAAFRYFTDDIGAWWPLGTHSVGARRRVTCSLRAARRRRARRAHARRRDARVGHGHAWDAAGARGVHVASGPVRRHRAAVDVRFTANRRGTLVTLTHEGWATLGARGPAMRDEYRNGWQAVLGERFVRTSRRQRPRRR